ncbi:hypothetical protein ILT42_18110 [Microvirga sp. BT291]|nr:hypothetical protein [Microvirga pudoricolor]
MYGSRGGDYIHGGSGSDTLTGGDGADMFLFTSHNGVDVFTDFGGGDVLHLDVRGFANVAAPGGYKFAPGQFVLGTTATSADSRIIYDAGTGNLYYDKDGLGGEAQSLFAKFLTKPALTESSFFVF